jgi:hypothetical protein
LARIAQFSSTFFPYEERAELGKALLQSTDSSFAFHCDLKNCGQSCSFAHELCPHADCGVVYSRKWAVQHDAECPQKPIDCERSCGRVVIRRLMRNHLLDECILRPVLCPFAPFGCESRKMSFLLPPPLRINYPSPPSWGR